MIDWQRRLCDEHQQLKEKIEKLIAFLNEGATTVTPEDKLLLTVQLLAMRQYDEILAMRVSRFT